MTTAKKTITGILLCMCFTLPGFAVGQSGSGVQHRSFALPQHGILTLNVPSTWKQTVRQPPGNLSPTISLSPNKGDEFKVLITPLWSPTNDSAFNKSEKAKNLIASDLREMLPGAVEQQVVIQEFAGVDGTGYYFLVTDKAPKPGDYPYAVRAGVGVGDLLLNVTVLSRAKNSEGIAATIKTLEQARQKGVKARVAKSYRLEKSDLPEGYRFVDKVMCRSIQPTIYYKNPEMYNFVFSSQVEKSHQSVEGPDETGSILYFQYKDNIPKIFVTFLAALFYDNGMKPTKLHPDEFMVKDNLLVVWCLYGSKNDVKSISRSKVNNK